MHIGYARVSTDGPDQTTDLQRDALIEAGVDPRHICLKTMCLDREPIDRHSRRPSTMYNPGMCCWFGSWTALVARFRSPSNCRGY